MQLIPLEGIGSEGEFRYSSRSSGAPPSWFRRSDPHAEPAAGDGTGPGGARAGKLEVCESGSPAAPAGGFLGSPPGGARVGLYPHPALAVSAAARQTWEKKGTMGEFAKLEVDGKTYEFPILEGSEGERAIDIGKLREQLRLVPHLDAERLRLVEL